MSLQAQHFAKIFSMENCVSQLVSSYETLLMNWEGTPKERDESIWQKAIERIKAERELLSNVSHAVDEAIEL